MRLCLAASSLFAFTLLAGCGSTQPVRTSNASFTETEPESPRVNVFRVESVERWSYEGRPGRKITTPGFTIYTTLEPTDLLIRRMPGFLEIAQDTYTSTLADLPDPPGRLDTYIMATRPEWSRLTDRLMGDQAAVFQRIQRGGFAARGIGVYFDIGPRDTLAVAAHEGWHQYTQSVFKQSLPVYLEEGIATYMEGFRWDPAIAHRPVFSPWANTERYDRLRDAAAKGRLLSLEHLLSTRPQDLINTSAEGTLDYYAQVWSLVHFLESGAGGRYRPSLRAALVDAASGQMPRTVRATVGHTAARGAMLRRIGPAVFQTYMLGSTDASAMARAEREYLDFVRTITAPGGRDDIVAGRSPLD